MHEKPNLYRNDYFIIGADVRGIDQDNTLRSSVGTAFSYTESLDTTYAGGYIGLGGEYSFGFIPGVKNVGGLYDRLGLRTFVSARAGLYNADTDYRRPVRVGSDRVQALQVDRRSRLHRHHLARDPQADRHAHQPVAVDRLRVHLLGAASCATPMQDRPTRIDDEGCSPAAPCSG